MFKKITAFLFAFCLVAMTACSNGDTAQNDTANAGEKIKVDKIFKNANVYTSEINNLHATSFAIKDGKFVYVGNDSNIWTTALSFGVNCTKKSLTLRLWEHEDTVMKYKW